MIVVIIIDHSRRDDSRDHHSRRDDSRDRVDSGGNGGQDGGTLLPHKARLLLSLQTHD